MDTMPHAASHKPRYLFAGTGATASQNTEQAPSLRDVVYRTCIGSVNAETKQPKPFS